MASSTTENDAYPGSPELLEAGYVLVKRGKNINSSSKAVDTPKDERELVSTIKKLQRIYSADKNPYRKQTMEYISRSRREIWKNTLGYEWVHQKHTNIRLPDREGFEYYYEDNYDTVGSVVPSLLEILSELPSFVSRIHRDTGGARISDPRFHDNKFAEIVERMKHKCPELLKKWLTFPLLYTCALLAQVFCYAPLLPRLSRCLLDVVCYLTMHSVTRLSFLSCRRGND